MSVTAQDAATVATEIHIAQSLVIGHSSGGAVALTYALGFPERVSHLIPVFTAASWALDSTGSSEVPYPSTEDEMRREFAASIPIAVHEPSKVSRAMEEPFPRMRLSPNRIRWTSEASRAEELHRGIPGSRRVLLDASGHWPFVEVRSDFATAVTQFLGLESHPVRRPT